MYVDREEDDNAVIRQAMPVLTDLQKITLMIDKIIPFANGVLVYTFQNPEIVKQLHTKLSLAHSKRPEKSNRPHITIAKELPEFDPAIYDQLPSYSNHLVECTSLRILKQLLDSNNGYSLVHEIK